jgi:predicted nucleotidyltransferase
MDRARIEQGVRARCAGRTDIAAVYLHGSHARRTARAASDVDVAVLYRDAPPPGLEALSLALEAELEEELGVRVQAVTLNTAPPDLIHRVLLDDVLLLERDASARVAFEVRARNEYFDVRPYLDEYRRAPV